MAGNLTIRTQISKKNENWKQRSPIDQYRELKGALEGALVMAQMHMIDGTLPEISIKNAVSLINQLTDLTDYLQRNPLEWVD